MRSLFPRSSSSTFLVRRFLPALAGLSVAGALAACGGLAGDPDQPRALATLNGELTNANAVTLPGGGDLRVAVIFRVPGQGDFARSIDLKVEPVFPSRFKLALVAPPPSEARMTADQLDDLEFADGARPEPPNNDPPEPPSASGPGPRPASGSVVLHDDEASLPPPPASFRAAVGSMVAYVDQNGNGKLDLVPSDATQYVDRVVGVNDDTLLVWIEGGVPEQLRDASGRLPSLGYNLFSLGKSCPVAEPGGNATPGTTLPTGQGGGQVAEAGTTVDPDAGGGPVPMPARPVVACDASAGEGWLPIGSAFDLPLSSDPSLASLMCANGGPGEHGDGLSSCGYDPREAADPNPPQPAQYPAAGAEGLLCLFGGKRYEYNACTTVDLGLCKGTHTTCVNQCVTKPPTTPAGWPCPVAN